MVKDSAAEGCEKAPDEIGSKPGKTQSFENKKTHGQACPVGPVWNHVLDCSNAVWSKGFGQLMQQGAAQLRH